MKIRIHPVVALLFIIVLSFALMAFQIVDESRMEEIIAGIVGFGIMLLGPKPLKKIFDILKIPGGGWRVLATYVLSGAMGFVVLWVAGFFTDVVWTIDGILVFAGVLATAAQMSYHRLKDLGRI